MSSTTSRLALGIVLAVAGCGSTASPQRQAPPASHSNDGQDTEYVASDTKGVQTMMVRATDIPEYLDLPAHTEPDPTRVVRVYAPIGGRIVEMKVRPWDRIEKGQVLAQLESSDLARAAADYHKALIDDRVKQEALARAKDLFEHHAISQRDYQQAQGDAQMAQAEVQATREQIRVFGIDPDHASTELRVTAPRSGVVLEVGAAFGEFSQALSAAQPLCTIADIGTIWAVGDIYEKDLNAARAGEPVQVSLNAFPSEHWSGRVGVVSDEVDPATRTLHVRVVLPNPGLRIKPRMFGTIRLLRSQTRGILVPASAVIREGNDSYMFVGKGNGRFERHSVQLGPVFDGSLEIVSGISAGDTIVSDGSLLLRSAGQD